jgi:glycosyltransferase involved in cell wall biosynthesis
MKSKLKNWEKDIEMRFSVIIPVYNNEDFLHKCINSILQQDYADYELILVDDGSTDTSRQICARYAAEHANVHLICQENGGPSAARNRGIECARGQYITFVDSDDWVKPNYFQTLSGAVATEADLVFFGTGHYNGTSETPKVFPEANITGNQPLIQFLTEHYLSGDICSVISKAFSRKMLQQENLRFPAGTVVEEDLQFVLQAADKAQSFLSIRDVLYCYNQRSSGSVTTKYNPLKFDSKIQAYRKELSFAEKWNQQRLAVLFRDNYLSYISSCINNLMYDACPLTAKEKLSQIRRFFRAEEAKNCIAHCKGIRLRSKVMYLLIRLRLYRVSYLLHRVLFCLRRR